MKSLLRTLLIASVLLALGAPVLANFDWTFTYQGKLNQNSSPVNGVQAMTFRLYDVANGGAPLGVPLPQNVSVSNGLFSVNLDFTNGDTIPGVFDGNDRWLEIEVNGNVLSPRQQLLATPHAGIARNLALPLNQTTSSPTIMHLITTANVGQVRGLNVETTSDQIGAIAIMGQAVDQTANTENVGVMGVSYSGNGFGVVGVNYATGGNTTAIYGVCSSSAGSGVYAYAPSPTGVTYGVYGQADSPAGYGGYFEGKGYFSKFTGVGRDFAIGSEIFGVGHPATSGYGGMYVETAGAGAWPFYGYATNGVGQMWTYYDGTTDKWHVHHGANRLTVQANGNVGIGTESPTALFSVNGTANKPGGGTWAVFSDARLKKNINDLDGALDSLLALHGVTFEYKDPASINETPGMHIGMIAQDVEKVFPQWISETSNGYKQLSFSGFEALTVEALRDLRNEKDAQIAQQSSRISALESENAALRQRLDAIEKSLSALTQKEQGQ